MLEVKGALIFLLIPSGLTKSLLMVPPLFKGLFGSPLNIRMRFLVFVISMLLMIIGIEIVYEIDLSLGSPRLIGILWVILT